MLPTYKRLDGHKRVAQVSFKKFIAIVLSLPLGAFTFCVLWSLIFEFERSTRTHCDVSNLLPSLSAAIGTYEPQKTIWRFAICLHMPARLVIAHMYYNYYRDVLYPSKYSWAKLAYTLNVIENLALVSLSLWTSTNDYEIHRNSFITFIVCSEFYMFISYALNKHGRRDMPLPHEEESTKIKCLLFLINLIAFSLAGYFFLRHNSYCEPGDESPKSSQNKSNKKQTKSRSKSSKTEQNTNCNSKSSSGTNHLSSNNTNSIHTNNVAQTSKSSISESSSSVNAVNGNTSESSTNKAHKNYTGIDGNSVKLFLDQYECYSTEVAPDVYQSVAERTSFMLWNIVNNIKIYSRKLGCKVSFDIVNDVLNDMDLPPALGALDFDWELFHHKDNDLFFMDKMIELRDEYQKVINIPMVNDPDFIASCPTDVECMLHLNKYIKCIIFVTLYGDSEALKDALSEVAFAPFIGCCYRLILGKIIHILAFKQNDQISERNWRLLRACASNPSTRDSKCREELFNLAEILVCQLLGPYESIKIHDNRNEHTPPAAESPEVEIASDDQDTCDRDGESDKIIVEIDLTSSDSMEQMELECEINHDEYIYKLLAEDDDENSELDTDGNDNDSENDDLSPYFATPATSSSVDELCETIGYLSASSAYFHAECLFHIKRRMERFFDYRNVSTEKEYIFISRLIRGLIALGEFAFREFIPYTYKFNGENIPEYLWSYFAQAAIFLRGSSDIFLYEWLSSICGRDKLQPFMVYKTRYITRLAARNFSLRKKATYHILPKIGVRRLETGSKSDLAIVTDVMLEPTLDEIFPKPTLSDFFPELAVRNTRRRRSSIRFKFTGCRPIAVKPKITKPEQLPQIKTVSTNHFSFSHILNINNNTHNHHNHNYTNWLKPQDVLIGRRRLLKPLCNGHQALPSNIFLTNNI